MKEFNYIINDKAGIHARPAGLIANVAMKFDCKITIRANGKEANARKLFDILKLGVKCGNAVLIIFDGNDEDAALAEIKKVIEETL